MKQLLEELFRAHYSDIYNYLFSLCRDPSLAEELTGDTFYQAVRSIGSFRGQADVKTWLFTIARRQWFAHLKRKRRTPEQEALSDLLPDHTPGPEDQILHSALASRVQALLRQEPERTQKVFRLRMEGWSFYEIGRALDLSENSARVIHFRLRSKLRAILTKEGFYP